MRPEELECLRLLGNPLRLKWVDLLIPAYAWQRTLLSSSNVVFERSVVPCIEVAKKVTQLRSGTKPSVGLFGYYGHFNFGDDLMALLFGQTIQKCGADSIVYSPEKYLGELIGAQSTKNINELVAGRDLVVYGGGGAFIPQPQGHQFSRTIARLIESCASESVPLMCLSVGGSGIALDQVTPTSRRELAQSSSYVSLRTRQEWELYRKAGIQADFYEDVVWLTSRSFPADTTRERATNQRVLVNLYPSAEVVHLEVERVFASISKRINTTEWEFVETHTFPSEYRQVFVPSTPSDRFSSYQFRDVVDGLEQLPKYDVVITNRLHVGIAAMSYGIRSIALFPTPKARMCYRELGLESLCWDETECERLEELDAIESREQLFSLVAKPHVPQLQRSAANHLTQLAQFVESVRGSH